MTKKKKVTKKNPVGRPTEYRPEYCQVVIDEMSKGFSKEAVAGHLRIAKDTLYEWEKKHPEFADALKKGVDLSRNFWEKIALNHLSQEKGGKSLNSSVWIFNMKNRFGWTDRREVNLGEESKDIKIELAYNLEKDNEDS